MKKQTLIYICYLVAMIGFFVAGIATHNTTFTVLGCAFLALGSGNVAISESKKKKQNKK